MVKVWTALWKLESLLRNCGAFHMPSIEGRAFRLRLFRIYCSTTPLDKHTTRGIESPLLRGIRGKEGNPPP